MMCWLTCSPHTKVRKRNECAIDLYVFDVYLMIKLQTVVELPEFQRRAKAVMSDDEREAAIVWIAENPEAGTSLGGGLRKVRIPREGGASGVGFGRSTSLMADICRSSWLRSSRRTRRQT